jgi:hypothetical protein
MSFGSIAIGLPLWYYPPMGKRGLSSVIFSSLLLACVCSGQSAKNLIWTGESGGFSIRWTDDDISAHPVDNPSVKLFSTRAIAEQASKQWFMLQKDMEEPDDEEYSAEKNCEFGASYRLLAVVGSIVAFECIESVVCSFAAHPDIQIRVSAFDLAKGGKHLGEMTSLTEYFTEPEILNELSRNQVIQRELVKRKAAQPKTLSELRTALAQPSGSMIETENCGFDFPPDILSRFAFHDLEKDKVVVRIGLPSSLGACQRSQLLLTLRLDIPEKLKPALTAAASGKQGFFMKDLSKFGASAKSDAVYEVPPQ